MLRFCLFACALSLVLSISIPLTSERQRCMVVYTPTADDFLKLDMKFDRFAGQSKQEGYRITLTNSQTNDREIFDVEQGTFRKEIELTENVIYKLCIKIVLDRYGGKPVEQLVEYNSGVKHLTSVDSANITVPANLLRFKDLQESYKHLVSMEAIQSSIQTIASQFLKNENAVFVEQQEEVKKLQWLTFLQFAAICLFGTYQYMRLKGIIQNAPK